MFGNGLANIVAALIIAAAILWAGGAIRQSVSDGGGGTKEEIYQRALDDARREIASDCPCPDGVSTDATEARAAPTSTEARSAPGANDQGTTDQARTASGNDAARGGAANGVSGGDATAIQPAIGSAGSSATDNAAATDAGANVNSKAITSAASASPIRARNNAGRGYAPAIDDDASAIPADAPSLSTGRVITIIPPTTDGDANDVANDDINNDAGATNPGAAISDPASPTLATSDPLDRQLLGATPLTQPFIGPASIASNAATGFPAVANIPAPIAFQMPRLADEPVLAPPAARARRTLRTNAPRALLTRPGFAENAAAAGLSRRPIDSAVQRRIAQQAEDDFESGRRRSVVRF